MQMHGPEGFPDSGYAFPDLLLALGGLSFPSAEPGFREGK